MPTLTIDHLPDRFEGPDDDRTVISTLRHWLVFEDGRIFFQDEELRHDWDGFASRRTPWEQLPTPPMTWDVVGLIDHGGLPLAILRNGEAYIWGHSEENAVDRWVPFYEPVPKTHAYGGYDR